MLGRYLVPPIFGNFHFWQAQRTRIPDKDVNRAHHAASPI